MLWRQRLNNNDYLSSKEKLTTLKDMKYKGSFTVDGSTLILSIPTDYFPIKWEIITCDCKSRLESNCVGSHTCDKIQKTLPDGTLTPVYNIEASRNGNENHCYSTRWYSCSVYQEGDHIHIENQGSIDEE
ncbi:Hypothetical protein HVR_LOCUS812 [uncultured virus]|nr:Hypothetical protein HVR_LOCUS812 [uncultured virus]